MNADTGLRRGDLAGLVLAGGRSRRMGRDKALLPCDTGTLATRALRALAPMVGELLIASGTGRSALFQSLHREHYCRIVEDRFPDHGPLAGIHAGFHSSDVLALLVLACDLPAADTHVLRLLLDPASDGRIVALRDAAGVQPLAALWPRRVLPRLERFLRDGGRSARVFLARVGLRAIDLPPDRTSALLNINTPADYDALTKHAESRD